MTPPRMHVLTATETDHAVILRRGPTRYVASIGWRRASDEFELGQWLHGRIYEHRSDLSPDGRHMIWFGGNRASIRNSRWYTCISRAPWLRAVAILPQGETWFGGGAFTEAGTVFLNGGGTLPSDADGLVQSAADALPHGSDGFHMGALYAAMMERRGWNCLNGTVYDLWMSRGLRDGWVLELGFRTWGRNRSLIANRYTLSGPGGARIEHPTWEWAEPWGDGVQFAARGQLHFARVSAGGRLRDERLIRDFSDMAFESREAPYQGVQMRDSA